MIQHLITTHVYYELLILPLIIAPRLSPSLTHSRYLFHLILLHYLKLNILYLLYYLGILAEICQMFSVSAELSLSLRTNIFFVCHAPRGRFEYMYIIGFGCQPFAKDLQPESKLN